MAEDQNKQDVFPERLRSARKLRKLEQSELATKAGLPPTSISHFESGARKPSFDNLRRLAIALEIKSDYLLGQTDDPAMSIDADPLYRDMKNLTTEDREQAKKFLAFLAQQRSQDGDK